MAIDHWKKDNSVALENEGVRVDIIEKVTGRAKYTADQYPKNMMTAGFIRCPYGNATLASADTDAAMKVPGVLEVEITREKGRYPGDRLGHLCAESKAAFDEGMAALALKFDTETPKTSLEKEMTPLDQISLEPDEEDEEEDEERATEEEINAIFAKAHKVIERTYETQVQTHCCLERHVGVVDFTQNPVVAWGSTQGTFSFRDELAEGLEMEPEEIVFHCEYVGGGFGSKFGSGAEGDLAGKMSKKHKRPCRVEPDRREEHLDTGMRPGSRQYMKIAVDNKGKMLGGRIHSWGAVGFSGGGGGVSNPSRYDFGRVLKTHENVHLNSQFPRPMRAPGHPQGMFAVEMMLDEIAAELGMDPLEFRKVNDPNETRKRMYDVGAKMIGWKNRKADGAGKGVVKRGFGMASADWFNDPGDATVKVNIYRSGKVDAYCGSQDIGTGFRTVLVDCVASQIGIPREWVTGYCGVSTYPFGPASGGSVTTRFVGPKALGAAEQAKQQLLKLVAIEWETDAAELSVENGKIVGGGNSSDWKDACKLISNDRISASVSEDGKFWGEETGSEAVQFAEVEVDTETGIVRVKKIVALQNCGQPVNRHTVENQICGGVIQGLSFALFENRILDPTLGSMVNANMDMYKIAGSVDIPEIVPVIWRIDEDSPVQSLGEPPVVPTAGAIGCAVANAIGAPVRSMPITPVRVLAALKAGKGATA